MQVYPALPWQGAINGGEIKLSTPVEFPELGNRLSVVLSYHGQGEEFEEAIFTTEGADIILARDVLGHPVRMYNVTISDDGKTIVLTNPTSDASSYPIWDIQERALRLYPSFPLSAGSNALLVLPHSMTSENIQEGLFPIFRNGYDEEVVGKVEVYPSDNKLYLATDTELWLLCANIDNQVPSARYYSLQLQPYTYQSELLSLENIVTTPSEPLMIPATPWSANLNENGSIILPAPLSWTDIRDGKLVFRSDEVNQGHPVGVFTVTEVQGRLVLMGASNTEIYGIDSFNGESSVIRLTYINNTQLPAPVLTEVIDTRFVSEIIMVPGSPWSTSVQQGKIILPSPVTRQDILDGALVFSTDYDIDGVHYDHFEIATYGVLTLQLGESGAYRVFEIGNFEGSSSVLSISRYDASSVAPLTAVTMQDVYFTPSFPWTGNLTGFAHVNKQMTFEEFVSKIKVYYKNTESDATKIARGSISPEDPTMYDYFEEDQDIVVCFNDSLVIRNNKVEFIKQRNHIIVSIELAQE